MDSILNIQQYLTERANTKSVIPKVLKFVFPEGNVIIDGTSGHYNIHQGDVQHENCTIFIDIPTFEKIKNKKLNPILAYTFKKLRVKGDIDLALKVIGFIQ